MVKNNYPLSHILGIAVGLLGVMGGLGYLCSKEGPCFSNLPRAKSQINLNLERIQPNAQTISNNLVRITEEMNFLRKQLDFDDAQSLSYQKYYELKGIRNALIEKDKSLHLKGHNY
jgi:hypothetical protein